ncbi:MAG: cytochrome c3 family protein [Thermoanaerobaculia bacterium]|nr:cytochrome c3 family protein [Thermoanaerobaculia bacterium]
MRRASMFLAALVLGAFPAGAQEAFDSSVCATCHEAEAVQLGKGPHAILDREAWHPEGLAASSCLACHGDPKAHVESGGEAAIFAFSKADAASRKNETCLGCHGDDHAGFANSPHAAAALDCSSCHSIHGEKTGPAMLKVPANLPSDLAKAGTTSASCSECHATQFHDFQFNERHRLQEGILECSSCHNPHEKQTRLDLGGTKNLLCTTCHTDKAGPFVFEHASVKTEGCVACHTPHGSVNRHMLKTQRVAELCLTCHATVPSFHSRFTLDTNCNNCHQSIHGSNFDETFLK